MRRARCMYDVCIYGVDGLDVVIGVRRARCMYIWSGWTRCSYRV